MLAMLVVLSSVISQQHVILKADDLALTQRWQRYFSYVESQRLVTTAGVIGNRLPAMSTQSIDYLRSLGFVEFWNHGWDHGLPPPKCEADFIDPRSDDEVSKVDTCEFYGTSADCQMEHMRLCHEAVIDYLGVVMYGFGAPENKHDCNTVPAFLACGYDHWYFPKYSMLGCRPSGVCTLARGGGEIEIPTGVPNFAGFFSSYDPNRPLLVLQVHPNKWDAAMFAEFQQCLEYLLEQGVVFTTPGGLTAPDPPQMPATGTAGLFLAAVAILSLYVRMRRCQSCTFCSCTLSTHNRPVAPNSPTDTHASVASAGISSPHVTTNE